jgi:rubredoxin
MAKWRCTVCGYIYDEDWIWEGKKNVRFEDLPSDWACPMCSASKSAFVLME